MKFIFPTSILYFGDVGYRINRVLYDYPNKIHLQTVCLCKMKGKEPPKNVFLIFTI